MEHIITQEDLDANPLLGDFGLQVGATMVQLVGGGVHSCPQGHVWNGTACVPDVG